VQWQNAEVASLISCALHMLQRFSYPLQMSLSSPPLSHHHPFQVLAGTGATREIANKLVHEEQQKPSELPDELRHGDDHGANAPGPMSSEDKHVSTTYLHRSWQLGNAVCLDNAIGPWEIFAAVAAI
jgi:hypothetical protein